MYMLIKIMLNEKKNVFLIKNTIICWTRLKADKLLATSKQLIRKNSVCQLKSQAISFTK